jgi:hypothetical protein
MSYCLSYKSIQRARHVENTVCQQEKKSYILIYSSFVPRMQSEDWFVCVRVWNFMQINLKVLSRFWTNRICIINKRLKYTILKSSYLPVDRDPLHQYVNNTHDAMVIPPRRGWRLPFNEPACSRSRGNSCTASFTGKALTPLTSFLKITYGM